jgi:hemin uptake protein HemP
MMRMPHTPSSPPAPPVAPSPAPRWSSETLLAGQRETRIVHQGAIYTLRLTASGKLILTK